ncbi:MAG: EscU/YscU/HrcU family type III secretion system export apparatus switch protein [Candidatus Eremiobacteraeota bacterium]|nr:EscU/YscU/HrcU family type III secretion system export apparatus switch protein [Candidatus Eremiobacteraeota bacterium]
MEGQNNERKALAVRREEDGTLSVLAYGEGEEADAIIERARESEVEIVKDEEEIRRLLGGTAPQAVPNKIYSLVAEIEAFVTELNEAWLRRDTGTVEEESPEEGEG